MFGDVYDGKKIFLTGHTGFKGSWLALWLKQLGADVTGYALHPYTTPNHWDLLGLECKSIIADIRDAQSLSNAIREAAPEIVFHLAAQPLVHESYVAPLLTWETNVMGTANLLEVCRHVPSVKAVIVITTDKCYENLETGQSYKEGDRLGGHDPYSASKAATEILVESYRKSFLSGGDGYLVATARAGNVIGGGDWSKDRLIPDLARAAAKNQPLIIRKPNATRPWQHVLEALNGYLMLGEGLLKGETAFAGAWNFGPSDEGNRTVKGVLETLNRSWPSLSWQLDASATNPHEATLLQLDSAKSNDMLGWKTVWSLDHALLKTAEWYKAYLKDGLVISRDQLDLYCGEGRL